jgi:hypothetical protein
MGESISDEKEKNGERWDQKTGMKSGSYLKECSFETLMSLLSETVEEIAQT